MTSCHDFRSLRWVICPVCPTQTRDITSSGRTAADGGGRRRTGRARRCLPRGPHHGEEGSGALPGPVGGRGWAGGSGRTGAWLGNRTERGRGRLRPCARYPVALSRRALRRLAWSRPALHRLAWSRPALHRLALSPPALGRLALSPPALSPPALGRLALSPPALGRLALSPPALSPPAPGRLAWSRPALHRLALSPPLHRLALSPPLRRLALSPPALSRLALGRLALSPPALRRFVPRRLARAVPVAAVRLPVRRWRPCCRSRGLPSMCHSPIWTGRLTTSCRNGWRRRRFPAAGSGSGSRASSPAATCWNG